MSLALNNPRHVVQDQTWRIELSITEALRKRIGYSLMSEH
jgi:hypothetical protein